MNEKLNTEAVKSHLTVPLKREYASENGTWLHEILLRISLLNPKYLDLKQRIFRKISAFVECFWGIGSVFGRVG